MQMRHKHSQPFHPCNTHVYLSFWRWLFSCKLAACLHALCRILKAAKYFWIPVVEMPVRNQRNTFSDKKSPVLIILRISGVKQSGSCMTISLCYSCYMAKNVTKRLSDRLVTVNWLTLAPAYFNMYQWKFSSDGWFCSWTFYWY